MLARLKYVSRFSRPLSSRDVESIVAVAQERNAPLGVTGVLLAYGEVFMQILEGPPEAVASTFARIERDPRHRDVVVLRRDEVARALFGGWSMRLLELDEAARREVRPLLGQIDSVTHGGADHSSNLHILDDMIWRTLGERGISIRRAG